MKCLGKQKSSKHVKVILLDDQEIIQEVQRSSKGQELLDNVFKQLNIIETSYFGLRFVDNTGQAHWLDPGKNAIRQLEGTDPAICYFGVKFYAADPCKLLEEITRYQFFLQIKKDILLGRLAVSEDLAAQLGAYAIQSELGDYDPKRHIKGYVSEFRFVSNQTLDLEDRITELHQTLAGEVPAIAELNYLEKVKWLDMYGVDLHPVLGEDKIDYFLGLTPSGIIVLRNKNKVGNYFWPRITKLTMKGKYFMIRVKTRVEEDTYGFETPSKAACKHLWKCATDHHTFFKLVQVTPTPATNLKKTFSLNSRFRSSNRSNISSASRRRAQPQFIRTPSRRYTRRFVEGSEAQGESQTYPENPPSWAKDSTQPSRQPEPPNWKPIPNSPKSIRSVPVHPLSHHHNNNQREVPSPKSTRSRKRSKSIESNSSYDDHSHHRRSSGRHHHSRRKHKHSSSSRPKQSDGESEVSTNSRSSKRRYKHKSSHYEKSGSDSEDASLRRRRHRHRSSSKKNDVIEWKEATMSTVQHGVSNVKTLGNEAPTDTRSVYSGKERHPRSRSHHRSPQRRTSHSQAGKEITKYFNYELVDTEGMDPKSIPDLQYTPVVTSGETNMKNRLLKKQHRSKPSATGNGLPEPPGTEQRQRSASRQESHAADVDRENIASTLEGSPPPPYSAPSNKEYSSLSRRNKSRDEYYNSLRRTVEPRQDQQPLHQLNGASNDSTRHGIGSRQPLSLPSNQEQEAPFLLKDHIENSDSGLGTDREYYQRPDNQETQPYRPPSRVPANTQQQSNASARVNHWADTSASHYNWGNQSDRNRVPTLNRETLGNTSPDVQNLARNRSSSLEMILSPLVSSTCNRTRL